MGEFEKYSKFYSALNAQKDYSLEVDIIIDLVNMHGKNVQSIADLGCGTGGHLSLLVNKIEASTGIGVDISESMLKVASTLYKNDHKLRFVCSDITSFECDENFDLVTSLFHVVSYINDYKKLEKFFQKVSLLLKSEGLFIFDYWSTSGVITNGVSETIRTAEVDGSTVTRKAKSKVRHMENIVDVNFNFEITREDKFVDSFEELHSMRHYTPAELIYFADLAGLTHISSFDSMSINELTNSAWASMSVFRKK
jgi:predicted TPR repeat methyltransferase